jgi:hypothetical protein
MNPEKFASAIGIAVFVGGSVGLVLHRIVPEKHLTGGSKDMIGAVAGLLTLLSALVLGLLIWTAYGVYAGQSTAIQTLAAKVLQFDLALQGFGPEASAARAQLRQGLAKSIDQVWGTSESDRNFAATNFAAAIQSQRNWEALLKRPQSLDGCAKAGDRRRDLDHRLDQSIAIADVLRACQPSFHSARGHGGRMGDGSLLRLRAALGRERRVFCRFGRRRSRGCERRLSDP